MQKTKLVLYFDTKNADTRRWFRRLRDAVSRLTLVVIIGFMLETALLYFFNGMWFVYTHTPVGRHYLTLADGAGESLQALFQSDLVMLGLRITLAALAVCLVAGAAGRLTLLQRYFFVPFGLLGRTIVWILPLTVLVARYLEAGDPVMVFPVAFGVALVPVAVLLKRTFILAGLLVPELSTVCALVRRLIGQIVRWAGSRQRRLAANRR